MEIEVDKFEFGGVLNEKRKDKLNALLYSFSVILLSSNF